MFVPREEGEAAEAPVPRRICVCVCVSDGLAAGQTWCWAEEPVCHGARLVSAYRPALVLSVEFCVSPPMAGLCVAYSAVPRLLVQPDPRSTTPVLTNSPLVL